MKIRPFTFAGLFFAAGCLAASAQQGPGPGRSGPPPQGEGARKPPEAVISQFDADGDGTLNEAEREAMREAMPERRGGPPGARPSREEMTKRYDADGDGQLSEEERAVMEKEREARRAEREKRREARRQEMLERFDADGDGQLSPEERETMRETVRAERPAPPASGEGMPKPKPAEKPEAAE